MRVLRDWAHLAGRLTAAVVTAPAAWLAEDRDRGEVDALLIGLVIALAVLVLLGAWTQAGAAR